MTLTGQVGLRLNGTTFVSHSIEWITKSHAHHIVVAISDTHCVSAEPGGAVIRRIDEYPELVWSQFDFEPGKETVVAFLAEHLVGHPYNYAAFTLVGIQSLTGWKIPDTLARAVSWHERMDCSQLADFCLAHVGIDIFDKYPGMLSPGDFEHYFRQRGWLPALGTVAYPLGVQ